MIIKGDKIKLVQKISNFDKVGDIFEVTGVDNGVVSFECNYGTGCMSYDEFEKYFEKVKKREWSKWFRDPDNRSIEPFGDGTKITTNILYRSNGKKVQIKCGGYRAEATCCKTDQFDLRTGYILAKRRLIVKMLQGQVDAYAKSL